MNRTALRTGLLAAALALATAACAPTGEDASAPPDAPPAGSTGGSSAAPAGGDRTPQAPQEVTIVTPDGMRFEPATLRLEAGRPVRLTVRNAGSTVHDFTLSQGVPRPVKLVVQPGQSAAATFTLARPGSYAFTCSQFGHSMAGMRGTITATAPGGAG